MSVTLPAAQTGPLLTTVPAAFHGGVNDVLLSALAVAVADWRRRHRRGEATGVLVDVEGHGREDIVEGLDLSRTVGWFTSVFPVRLDPGLRLDQCREPAALGSALKRVKEQLRAVPDNGVGFGALRYLNPETGPILSAKPRAQVGFNYLGRFSAPATDAAPGSAHWEPAPEGGVLGGGADPAMALIHGLELNAVTTDHPLGPQLHATWSWAGGMWSEADVEELARSWFDVLGLLAAGAEQPGAGGHSPSDFLALLSQDDINELEAGWSS